MIVITFRNRLAPGIDLDEYEQRSSRLFEIVAGMPGFRSIRSFTSDDGERLALIEFASLESLAAWRDHPEHCEAQRLGRERYYSEYYLEVCERVRDSHQEPRG